MLWLIWVLPSYLFMQRKTLLPDGEKGYILTHKPRRGIEPRRSRIMNEVLERLTHLGLFGTSGISTKYPNLPAFHVPQEATDALSWIGSLSIIRIRAVTRQI